MNKTVVLIGAILLIGIVIVTGILFTSRNNEQPAGGITDATWQWTSMKESSPPAQSVVPDPARYTITFKNDGTFEAKVDCNQVSGTYSAVDGGFRIVPGPSTMAECGPESLYNTFLANLAAVDGYTLQGDLLTFSFGAGAGEMAFKSQ